MSDVILKSISLPAASSGLSALAPVQAQAQVQTSPATSVSAPSTKAHAASSITSAASHEHSDLLAKAAANIERYMPKQPHGTQLRIEKDKGTNLFVYKSVDPKSGQVVSQYPSEQILKFISYFRAKEGLAVDQSA